MAEFDPLRILLVEDNPVDRTLADDLFADDERARFRLEQVERLSDAMERLEAEEFDAVLLDLALPDSKGVETFAQLHSRHPDVPILVLTAIDDSATAEMTVREGAEDFVVKKQAQKALLRRAVRFAVLRTAGRQERESERQMEAQSREIAEMRRLSTPTSTTVTARMYAGSPLRETAPGEFNAAVSEYFDLLEAAIEQRIFKSESDCSERLRELGLQLGFLRAGPRDVVEIHTAALKKRLDDAPAPKARAYLEEARITVLELMGHLTSYYRNYYATSQGRD